MNQLYDVNAAARLLAVSPWTVRAYIRQRRLRPVRIGRLVRLDEEELSRFVASTKNSERRFAESGPVRKV
jgi:excisionase family DNA binding protein